MISGKTCQWKARIHRVYSSDRSLIGLYGPRCEKTCLQRFANNTGADQPAHLLSDQRLCYDYLESIISKLATSEMPIFYLVPVAEETGLSLVFFRKPQRQILGMRPIYIIFYVPLFSEFTMIVPVESKDP